MVKVDAAGNVSSLLLNASESCAMKIENILLGLAAAID
jgi:hypothetical protein